MPQPPDPDIAPRREPLSGRWVDGWMTEAIRLRESLWGPLEDSNEVRRARSQGATLEARITLRARQLAQREKLDEVLHRWRRGAQFALALLALLALMAGAAAGLATLGDGQQSVNVMMAIAAALGVHTLTLLVWLGSLLLGRGQGLNVLGDAWLWLTRRLARGPDAALAPAALVAILGRNNGLRWVLGSVSHGLWLCLLLGMLSSLLWLLATRSYAFHWETTVLPEQAFVRLTAILGWLPGQLGFHTPTDGMVLASGASRTAAAHIHTAWSTWLIGCILLYGLVPRLLALVFSLLAARRNIDASLAGAAATADAGLRQRLMPSSERAGVDTPYPEVHQPALQPLPPGQGRQAQTLLAGIELAGDTPWPPVTLDTATQDLGIIDTRAQRHAVLDYLHQFPANRLVLVCDARQTPDRGVIALLASLAGQARQTGIVLSGDGQEGRRRQWHQQLAAAGFRTDALYDDLASALAQPPVQTEPNA